MTHFGQQSATRRWWIALAMCLVVLGSNLIAAPEGRSHRTARSRVSRTVRLDFDHEVDPGHEQCLISQRSASQRHQQEIAGPSRAGKQTSRLQVLAVLLTPGLIDAPVLDAGPLSYADRLFAPRPPCRVSRGRAPPLS